MIYKSFLYVDCCFLGENLPMTTIMQDQLVPILLNKSKIIHYLNKTKIFYNRTVYTNTFNLHYTNIQAL